MDRKKAGESSLKPIKCNDAMKELSPDFPTILVESLMIADKDLVDYRGNCDGEKIATKPSYLDLHMSRFLARPCSYMISARQQSTEP